MQDIEVEHELCSDKWYQEDEVSLNRKNDEELGVKLTNDGHTQKGVYSDYGCQGNMGRNYPLVEKKNAVFSKAQVNLALQAIKIRKHIGITAENCTTAYIFGREKNIQDLTFISGTYMLRNILEASKYPDFLKLSARQMQSLLSCHYLNVVDEYQVFELAMVWLKENRARFDAKNYDLILMRLLKCIRTQRVSTIEQIYVHECLRNSKRGRIYLEHALLKLASDQFTQNTRTGDIEMLNTRLVPIRPRLPTDLVVTIGGWHYKKPMNIMEIYDSASDHWYTYEFSPNLPNRAYHGMVNAPNRCVYLIGGLDDFSTQQSSVVQVDVVNLKWKYLSNMIDVRCFPSCCWCLGKLYVLGGMNKNVRMKSAEVYDVNCDRWKKIANMNYVRSDGACGSVNG